MVKMSHPILCILLHPQRSAVRKAFMNAIDKQERRARARLSIPALLKASLIAGAFVYVLLAGGPWMSYDTGYASMGRIFPGPFFLSIVYQALFAIAYGWLVAQVIYRLPLAFGIIVGIFMGFPLYLLNSVMFRWGSTGSEIHVVISHIVFAPIFTATYRALAVPKIARN
jgi:hypothetical protein